MKPQNRYGVSFLTEKEKQEIIMKEKAPVILFVYNRLEHTKQTLESLARNLLAKKSKLYIFSDGCRAPKDKEGVDSVREYIDQVAASDWFGQVEVIKSAHNKGLAKSIISGVTQIIKEAGRVIVLEDDLLTDPLFLNYMNDALDHYSADNRIWGVSAYSSHMKSVTEDVYFVPRLSSWGWGTWKSCWDQVDWDVKSYDQFRLNLRRRRAFNLAGNDLAYMLDRQMRGEIDSWAIRFCYSMFEHGKYAVFPRCSLVRNIGQDGSGTHCKEILEEDSFSSRDTAVVPIPFYIEDLTLREYKKRKKVGRLALMKNYLYLLAGK